MGIDWVKISTDILQDEKIQIIEGMPEGDTLFSMWIKLLVLAGRSNQDGYLYICEDVPYGVDEFSTIFHKSEKLTRSALSVFLKLKMITEDSINGYQVFYITHWLKHQNIDGLDKIREQTRVRTQNYRKRLIERKQLLLGMSDIKITPFDVTVTSRDETDLDKEIRNKNTESKYLNKYLLEDDQLINSNTGEILKTEDVYTKEASEIWNTVLVSLQNSINKLNYRAWLEKTKGFYRRDGEFTVVVPNEETAQHISQNFMSLIEKQLIEITQKETKVKFAEVISGNKN
jgi:predicted phage replisome organizer